MCGIFAYKGEREEGESIVLNGLKKLEYRGYDSWGLANLNNNKISIKKDVGQIHFNFNKSKSHLTIGHTRWATHGIVNTLNAHPHNSKNYEVVSVHNGIIENASQLIKKYNLDVLTQTDSEVIPLLTQQFIEKGFSFVESSRKTLLELKGSFAVALIHKHSDELVAARFGSPLIVGVGKNEFFLSSDIPSLSEHVNKIINLKDKDFVVINKYLNIEKLDTKIKILPEIKSISQECELASKGEFKHYMLKEIYEQPESIKKTLNQYIKNNQPNLNLKKINLKNINRIIILACGTSWHAGLVGEFIIEGLAKVPVEVEYASEFRYKDPIITDDSLIIAISQSGETADTLSALKEAKRKGASVLSICNVKDSSIASESDDVLYTLAGPEIGVASTKAFSTQIIMLYLLAVQMIMDRNVLSKNKIQELIFDIKEIPDLITKTFGVKDQIKKIAKNLSSKKNMFFLGRGIQFPIALEGALKLKEVSYIHTQGYPAAEMKHGPIALIDKYTPSIFIATKDSLTYDKIISNMQEIKTRQGPIIAIASQGDKKISEITKEIIFVPRSRYILSSLITIIPLQLLAYYVALEKGTNVDKPRNLAKSVTVE